MREFSVGEAILAGFRLIGREPLAFLAWALVYAVVGVVPQLVGTLMGLDAVLSLGGAGAQPNPDAIARAMGPLQSFQPLSMISSILSALVTYGAVYRAMLYPDDRRFLYLRLGPRELWMGLSIVAIVIILAGGLLAMMIPFFVIVGVSAAGGSAGAGAGALAAVVLFLAAFGVFTWAYSRLSLAMPMSFAERNFRIPEAWKISAGHAGRILLVMLGLFAILLVAEALLFGVAVGVLATVAPLGDLARDFSQNPAKLFGKVPPWMWAPVVVVWALFGAWSVTVFNAALAEIYKGLLGPDTADIFA